MTESLKRCVWWVPFFVTLFFLAPKFGFIDGKIGHDYYHDIPRFLIGKLHFQDRGLAAPHYTAYLCGGLPLHANPQSAFYSVPQFLSFSMDPFLASRVTILLFYVLGYLGALLFFKRAMGVSSALSHLGALLWIQNGFAFAHLFVGHLTHHSYLLLPWLLYFLFSLPDSLNRNFWRSTAWVSLILIYTFYSGGLHVLVVFAFALVLAFPAAESIHRERKSVGKLLLFILAIGAVTFAATSGKLALISRYSRYFLVGPIDSSGENPLTLAFRYFWFLPSTAPTQAAFGRILFGAWEYIGFLSKLTLVGAITFCYFALRGKQVSTRLYVLYGVITLIILILAAGTSVNSSLPFLRDYHNPLKILGSLSFFLIIATVFAIRSLKKQKLESPYVFLIAAAVLLFEFSLYTGFFVKNRLGISFEYQPITSTRPVNAAVNALGADITALQQGFTSLKCYEPALGYRHENLLTTVQHGSVSDVRDGAYNLTQPACLLFPEKENCKPWDRIPVKQKEQFRLFAGGHTAPWQLPTWLSALLFINAGVVLALLVFLVASSVLTFRARLK